MIILIYFVSQDYIFESKQYLKILVLNNESNIPAGDIEDQNSKLLGRTECLLSHIVGARGSSLTKDLSGTADSKRGQITILAEELAPDARKGDTLVLRMVGQALAPKDWGGYGGSDPYLVFHNQLADGSFAEFHKTEVRARASRFRGNGREKAKTAGKTRKRGKNPKSAGESKNQNMTPTTTIFRALVETPPPPPAPPPTRPRNDSNQMRARAARGAGGSTSART